MPHHRSMNTDECRIVGTKVDFFGYSVSVAVIDPLESNVMYYTGGCEATF